MKRNVIREKGNIVEIQENGETVWKDEDYIQRPEISEESRKRLKESASSEFEKEVYHILTGEKLE
jgi:hypothetical protein